MRERTAFPCGSGLWPRPDRRVSEQCQSRSRGWGICTATLRLPESIRGYKPLPHSSPDHSPVGAASGRDQTVASVNNANPEAEDEAFARQPCVCLSLVAATSRSHTRVPDHSPVGAASGRD